MSLATRPASPVWVAALGCLNLVDDRVWSLLSHTSPAVVGEWTREKHVMATEVGLTVLGAMVAPIR